MKGSTIPAVGRLACACLMGAALAACSGGPKFQPGMVPSYPVAAMGQEGFTGEVPTSYVLRPSDAISVRVFREDDLSAEQLIVSADGMISLPLVGPLKVQGMSIGEVEASIADVLRARYLRDPQVAVNIVSYMSHQVTVDGAVEEAGVFDFRPGTRLSGGIALAGGPSRVAENSQVAIFRQTPEGMAVAKFDYSAVRAGTMLDPMLEPGDRIVIGTDGLSQFWQDFLRSIPLFALFTRI